MAYSKRLIKGRVGYCRGTDWPLIVIERAKSDKPLTPVLCEVWGFEHESGSVYLQDIELFDTVEEWADLMKVRGFSPERRYFKGELVAHDLSRALGG